MLLYRYVVRLARSGRYREAESWLAVLLKIAPHPDLYCLLGKIHAQQRHYEDASRSFREALTLEPGHTTAASAQTRLEELNDAPWLLRLGAWRLGSAVLVLLLAISLIPMLFGRTGGGDGDTAALSSAENRKPPAPDGAGASRVVSEFDVRLLDEYASLVDSLRSLRTVSSLVFTPRVDGSRLTVRIMGAVPTDHLRTVVERAGSRATNIDVDATGLDVTHKYVVKPGDTLSSIAGALYGDSGRWTGLWAVNERAVPLSDVIHPGTSLATP